MRALSMTFFWLGAIVCTMLVVVLVLARDESLVFKSGRPRISLEQGAIILDMWAPRGVPNFNTDERWDYWPTAFFHVGAMSGENYLSIPLVFLLVLLGPGLGLFVIRRMLELRPIQFPASLLDRSIIQYGRWILVALLGLFSFICTFYFLASLMEFFRFNYFRGWSLFYYGRGWIPLLFIAMLAGISSWLHVQLLQNVFGGRKPASDRKCSKCSYDLRGSNSGTCPECGKPFILDSAPTEIDG